MSEQGKDDIKIRWPFTGYENTTQSVSAHSVTVEFEDGSSWQLGYLLRRMKNLIEAEDE